MCFAVMHAQQNSFSVRRELCGISYAPLALKVTMRDWIQAIDKLFV